MEVKIKIEEKIKLNLITRGFDSNTQLNNRRLIDATIHETLLEVVKNFSVDNKRELLTDFARTFRYRGEGFMDAQIKGVVDSYFENN